METKKKPNYFKIILISLFVIYISLYILNSTGYYDGSIRRKTELTESEIKRFEKDIDEGKVMDVNDYLEGHKKDYTNKTSKMGYAISTNLEYCLNEGIKEIIKVLSKLFT